MRTIWQIVGIVGRLCRIVLAYLVSVSAATLLIFLGLVAMDAVRSGTWIPIRVGSSAGSETSGDGSGLILFAWLVVAAVTIAPALFGVGYSEAFAVRRCRFHAGCGVAAAAIPFLFSQSVISHPPPFLQTMPVLGVLLVAGCIGGSVYWLIAGRSAGNWPSWRWKAAG